MSAQHHITILGSTGSVGQSTLAVIEQQPSYKLYGLSAHTNVELLLQQCLKFKPKVAVVSDEQAAEKFASLLTAADCQTKLLVGAAGLASIAVADEVTHVMAAIVGSAGLESVLAAAEARKRILLANKESLVMAGSLLIDAVRKFGASIIPIDSEHNAIFQCLPNGDSKKWLGHIDKVVLTASGGPFLNTSLDDLDSVTPAQACRHPKWNMGRKISVDSASMMNKGLEFIEVCLLFDLEPKQVEVLIHPQSIVHSMVYYRDGSVLAQMANPDMRIPIAHGLAFPQRISSGAELLSLSECEPLEFLIADLGRFPCLALGIEAAKMGGNAPIVLNAANEEAVAAFLSGDISFSAIPLIIAAVMSKMPCEAAPSLAIIQGFDQQARNLAKKLILKEF